METQVSDPSAVQPERTLALLDAEASRWLAWIAERTGADSPLHRGCREMWRDRLEAARVSIGHGDVRNALVILERGLQLLSVGPVILARRELRLEEFVNLLRAY